MNPFEIGQILFSLMALIIFSPILGVWIAKVMDGEQHFLSFIKPLETVLYKISGVRTQDEMNWREYLFAVLLLGLTCFLLVFGILIAQGTFPLNPQNFPGLSWHLAFNTAMSFMTNTNWQSYGGESTMSYFTQMVALTVQNFVSAAVAMAVLMALARGIRQKETDKLGNFWIDLTRVTLYILLPISFIYALFLIGQGVIQNLSPYISATTIEGVHQILPMGPAASQIAIKQIGTNGGGFFNVNSAHPFENPTPFSNWLELFAILMIPAALPFAFGKWVRSKEHGKVIFVAMLCLLICALGISLWSEYQPSPVFGTGALMEGKETRLGIANSVVWSVFTTAASNGSVNAMHSSLSPISGGVALLNMMLGEVIFGGVGCGLYGMVIFIILTVFIAGLMVGRSPEYLGKKIEGKEVKMAILAVLAPNAIILIGSALSAISPVALSSISAKGPHGLTEVLYALTSGAGNNGSAFAGLNANTPYWNILIGIAMFIGRFGILAPVLVIAGSLSMKKITPPSPGTFKTETPIFVALLIGTILIVGALTFFPVLSLGPIIEHFLWQNGKTF